MAIRQEIKSPWTLYPFSADQFKNWRLGYVGRNSQGEIVRFPPKFEGPEWRRADHRKISYDAEALELFFQYLGNPDRAAYRAALRNLLDSRVAATPRRGRPSKNLRKIVADFAEDFNGEIIGTDSDNPSENCSQCGLEATVTDSKTGLPYCWFCLPDQP